MSTLLTASEVDTDLGLEKSDDWSSSLGGHWDYLIISKKMKRNCSRLASNKSIPIFLEMWCYSHLETFDIESEDWNIIFI